MSTCVTAEDYQYYWKRVKERSSLSYSRLHYGHYVAAADSKILFALHAAEISEAARRGVSLERWGFGVTFLLEKNADETLVTKLRIICLSEADFNYWTKLIFARRMTKKAHNKDSIPDEVYAKKDSHYDDATMTNVFFCDLSKIMRHPAVITEADLGECYDRMARPLTTLAMQSWEFQSVRSKECLLLSNSCSSISGHWWH